MKFKIFVIVFVTLLIAVSYSMSAQNVRTTKDTIYVVKTYNGGEFIGQIVNDNSKELTISTLDRGEITIPKYEIKEIIKQKKNSIYRADDKYYQYVSTFGKNYFLTKNAFSLPENEIFLTFNYILPDLQYGVTDNFDVGIMTSIFAVPLVFNADYTIDANETVHIGLGSYIGFMSWAELNSLILLPNMKFTFGSIENNISFMGGYAYASVVDESISGAIFSVGAAKRLSKKWSFVFESVFGVEDGLSGYIIPSIRYYSDWGNWQFGFSGVFHNSEVFPLPVPALSRYIML